LAAKAGTASHGKKIEGEKSDFGFFTPNFLPWLYFPRRHSTPRKRSKMRIKTMIKKATMPPRLKGGR
jgi:hypothetical protein